MSVPLISSLTNEYDIMIVLNDKHDDHDHDQDGNDKS